MRCRYCRAWIVFVTLRSGRRMPVEADEPEEYHVHLGDPHPPQIVLVTDAGDVLRGRRAERSESGTTRILGRESHFATCPGAAEARKP